jgi:hypothetical protein
MGNIHIYPNPSNNGISVVSNDNELLKISVINWVGQVVLQENNVMPKTTLNVSSLSNGFYFIMLEEIKGNTTLYKTAISY